MINSSILSPFGITLDNRTISSDSYRYGFGGMEKDDEIKGDGNSYDFGARMLDPRVGRWLTIDPLSVKYPGLSPYVFCADNPVIFIDPDGKKFVNPYIQMVSDSKLKVQTAQQLFQDLQNQHVGELKSRDIKKYEKQSGLQDAQEQLKLNENKCQLVDDMLYTLKVTNPTEFSYFDNLKDLNGDVLINVIIQESGPAPASANTNGLAISRGQNGAIYPMANASTGIDIVLYTKNIHVVNGVTIISRGDDYPSFCNELGDIQFFFSTVQDQATLDFQQSTCGPDDKPGDAKGYEDPKGAGQQSFDYEFNRKKEVKNYAKNSLQTGETFNTEKTTIEKR